MWCQTFGSRFLLVVTRFCVALILVFLIARKLLDFDWLVNISVMNIVIAPNAFKGSLSAAAAADAIIAGLNSSRLQCQTLSFPIADGGDGTAALLSEKWHAETVYTTAHDPLMRAIRSSFAWIPKQKTGVIGMSDASGLLLLKKDELDPMHANTFGTGELILAALDKGATSIIVAVGGSATVDGGTGMLRALGVRFLNASGQEMADLPADLKHLDQIDVTGLDPRLKQTIVTVLCDVQNKLLGREGAAAVFGPQKGAGSRDVAFLESCLSGLTEKTRQILGKSMSDIEHGGAAGGIAAALAVYLDAKLESGIEYFLESFHFDRLLDDADLLITAEGKFDKQTLGGKGPYEVARRAHDRDIPVIGFAGEVDDGMQNKPHHIFRQLIAINPAGVSLEEAIRNTAANLQAAAQKLGDQLCSDSESRS